MVKYFRKTVSLSDLWVSSHERLSDFYASSWQRGDSPMPLLVVRMVVAILALAILAWSVYEAPSPYWLIYLTNWGLVLVSAMAVSGVIVSLNAAKKALPEEGVPPWHVSMYWVFYNIAGTIAIVITLLYWILLFDSSSVEVEDRMFWLETVTHGFNTVLVLVELFASRTPLRFAHIYQPLGVGLWYAVFSVIYYFAGGTDGEGNPFIYAILDWSRPGPTTALVVGAIVGLILVYSILWGFTVARDKLTGSLIRTTSHTLPFTPPDYVNGFV
ncbi:protein rolling stone-like isoform X2 [Leguminivora glycinivorella]|uniref:protein rolling stone-like isoform X2 n=1 Tax=Leguminivora glycinivorella TaxID=1035111 RepID=UPI00200D6A9E|nr:protein rolling stone-like isoform X2 [Leguminivora glycinivorella]